MLDCVLVLNSGSTTQDCTSEDFMMMQKKK